MGPGVRGTKKKKKKTKKTKSIGPDAKKHLHVDNDTRTKVNMC